MPKFVLTALAQLGVAMLYLLRLTAHFIGLIVSQGDAAAEHDDEMSAEESAI